MPLEARLLMGLALALGGRLLATPVAIRVADRLEFYDQPVGYKGHRAPTPYLGGAAVIAGFLVAVLLLGGGLGSHAAARSAASRCCGRSGRSTTGAGHAGGCGSRSRSALAAVLWALGLGWDLGLGARGRPRR